MRTILVLIVALGLPLGALAQGRLSDSSNSIGGGGGGQAAGGCPLPPANALKDDPAFDAPSDAANQGPSPSPGTQAYLEKEIELLGQGRDNDAQLDVGLARAHRQQLPAVIQMIKCAGKFRSITFLHASKQGLDDYEVAFTNGAFEWAIKPLNADQKVSQEIVRPFFPQPATRRLEDFVKSLQQGKPDYANLSPELAARFQAQEPALQKQAKGWGALGAILFERQGDDGVSRFVMGFRQRRVLWDVGPIDANGKFTSLNLTEGPG